MWLTRSERALGVNGGQPGNRITIPWFAVGCVAMAGVNSWACFPRKRSASAFNSANALLALAMAALGLTTHIRAVRAAGTRPLILALALFAWLLIAGLALNLWILLTVLIAAYA